CWFRITNSLNVTGIKMGIAFFILTQGLLQYSKLVPRFSLNSSSFIFNYGDERLPSQKNVRDHSLLL
ncbi:MAG: hypothetical protein WBG51_13700, partial [Syntrophobacteria bacterium]